MSDLIGEQTETLFLFYPRIKEFDQIVRAPNLRTLYICQSKTKLDISVLSMNSHIENIKIEKCPHVNGWERLRAKSLKVLEVDIFPSAEVLGNLPHDISFYGDRVEGVREKPFDKRADLAKIGDPFRSITDVWYPRRS